MSVPRLLARLFRGSSDEIRSFEVATVVGPGVNVRGDVRGPGGIRVDGHVTGSVESDGPVVVGEGGVVDGTVRGSDVIVLGRVRGDVQSARHLEVGPRGKVVGDVTVESLRLHKGGVFRGTSRMTGGEDVATSTASFGVLPIALPQMSSPHDEETAVRGRTLPPPAGAVPPPASVVEVEDAPAVSASPIPPPLASEKRLTSGVRPAPPLPEGARAVNGD